MATARGEILKVILVNADGKIYDISSSPTTDTNDAIDLGTVEKVLLYDTSGDAYDVS